MGMNPETKVGIMTATALLALFSLFFWLNRVNFLQKGSELDIVFERIDGLRPGAPVKYMGVDVGRISKIYFENQKIIIRVHIYEGYEVPLTSGAYITSSGVVGDKFVDILPLKAGVTPLSGNRIRGQSPESLDTLYAAANQVMEKLKVTVDSLNQMLGDPKMATSLKNTLANLESLTATANGLIANNASSLNNLVSNATLASDQLASACTSANSLLKDLDANGQTAGDLKEFLTHIKSVSANLESFSVILAEKGPQLGVLADDAHKTMGAITDAAKSVTDTLGAFSSGEGGDQPDLKQTLGQTAAAAQKVSAYVQNFQKMTFANQAGFSYYSTENSDNIAANYQLDMDFDAATALRVGLEDIGHDNLATVQYNMKKPHYSSRVGIYRNQVGVGMDFNAPANHTLGVDLWDTRNATLGLSSKWKLTPVWSMSISAASELEDPSTIWNVGWWRKF